MSTKSITITKDQTTANNIAQYVLGKIGTRASVECMTKCVINDMVNNTHTEVDGPLYVVSFTAP